MSDELEPCPFCGRSPQTIRDVDGWPLWAECKPCGIDAKRDVDWNRRAPAAPAVQEPAAVIGTQAGGIPVLMTDGSMTRMKECKQVMLYKDLPVGTLLYAAPVPAIPPGYRLVPIEPTPEMLKAATAASPGHSGTWANMNPPPRHIYKAMLAAAPQSTVPQDAKDAEKE